MNERNETTELKLNATMTLNGLEVPLTATVDLLQARKADVEAVHRMMADDDGPPTLRQKRRTEHLGTENVVNRSLFWRKAKGTILHAVAYQTILRQDTPWTLQQPFTRYVNGYNQEELPEVKHLEVPDEDGLDYCTGVALATFDGVPVELSFWVDRDFDSNIRIYAAEEHKDAILAMHTHLEDAAYRYLRGRALDGHFNFISRSAISSEDVLLEDSVMQTINKHVVDYRLLMPAIAAAGESPSRGLLMAGPPGCGKTSATRYIVSSMPEVTFVMVSGTSIQRDGFRSIWELVRKTDGVLVIEDIDSCGAVSRDLSDHPLLSQLLELLDGLEDSGLVQVLATTNHADRLDPALTARPGRFDRVIQVHPPNAEVRRELLRRTLFRFSPTSTLDLDKAVSRTAGFTGAYVVELAKSAWLEAMHAGDTVIASAHLNAALNDVNDQFKRALEGHRSTMPAATAASIGGWE